MGSVNGDVDEVEILIEQIESEMRKIHTSTILLSNNLSISDPVDPLEHGLIRNFCYLSILKDRGIDDEIHGNNDELKLLKETLEKELDFLSDDVKNLMLKMNDDRMLTSSIDTNMMNLKLMMESDKRETTSKRNFDEITKNIKMRFKKEKSDLKTIITTLFAESLDIQDLIAKTIEHHLNEGSDKYLQLENEDNILEQIETLCRTNLFEVNRHDSLQIRLADLI